MAGPPPAAELPAPATQPVRIIFADSAKEARWKPGDGNLLEVAEARGLEPAFGCRGGSCGDCRARVLEGGVTYASPPSFAVPAGGGPICFAGAGVGRAAGRGRVLVSVGGRAITKKKNTT